MPDSEQSAGPVVKLDHICLCVRRIAEASTLLGKVLGYRPRTRVVENTRQQVNVQFLSKHGSVDLKLIEPSGPDSPLVDHLHKRGPGLHHLAFFSDSLSETEVFLKEERVRIVAGPQPGEAFEDELILFAFLNCGLSVEFIETTRRRSLLHPDK